MDLPLIIHVTGGAMALLAGTYALTRRKGGDAHIQAGKVFVVAMLVMAITGGVGSYLTGKAFDALSSVLSCYMVMSGWIAFQPHTRRHAVGLGITVAACLVGYLTIELYARATGVRATDAPLGAGYIFAAVCGLALFGDYKVLARTYSAKQKTIRHLWRMNFGLLVASGSFFGARPHLFPEWMQTYGVLMLLTLAPVLVMAYWSFKLRNRTPEPA